MMSDSLKRSCFQPPSGGDITLRSSDGVEFRVHAVIMSMVSSVFQDMFAVGTACVEAHIDLAEDAQAISLMLEFIYPTHQPPDIIGLDTLSSCLEIAQKYDIEAMLKAIDRQLSAKDLDAKYTLFEDPLVIYRFGVDYNLPYTRVCAARRIAQGGHDLLEPESLAAFARAYPSHKSLIALAGAQGARYKILTDGLFDPEESNMRMLATDPSYFRIACDGCQDRAVEALKDGYVPPLPGWAAQWARAVHRELIVKPLEQCSEYFDSCVFISLVNTSSVICVVCLRLLLSDAVRRDLFNSWADGVKTILEARLDPLGELYSMC